MLKIRPLVIDSILYATLFAFRLPVSRCSLKFHRFLYYVTYYTVFFHLALATLMNKINESKDCSESKANAGQEMPADFGLPTATFIVIAGMVGTGILTTSGFTVLDVGSNQWMLLLWVIGGITAICGALTVAELSAALPRTGGDYVYLYEAYRAIACFFVGMGVVSDRVCGAERGLGVRVRQVHHRSAVNLPGARRAFT